MINMVKCLRKAEEYAVDTLEICKKNATLRKIEATGFHRTKLFADMPIL